MYKRYEIKGLNDSDFENKLGQEALPYAGNRTPLINILKSLSKPPLSCRTVIFEYDYVDEIYQDEYSTFYSKGFKAYPDRCTRLHFFSCIIPQKTRINFHQYAHSYIGFMVLRPTELQRVGRTILTPPANDPETEFINCNATFTSHILGQAFNVQAMPFIQQDTQVGACAQASLWMLSCYMGRRFGYRRYMPSEINQFAKSKMGLGRHYPAENGLSLPQILEALDTMGFSAIPYMRNSIDHYSTHIEKEFPLPPSNNDDAYTRSLHKQRTIKLADIAYRYIESGLPVIFGTSDHAMVGIGHKYDSKASANVAIQRIPAFFINNDNCGCYREMPISGACSEYTFEQVNSIIAVTPSEATLRGENAEDMARNSVSQLLKFAPDNTKPNQTYQNILQQMRPDFTNWLAQLEYRTFLVESIVFQADLRIQMRKGHLGRKIGERLLKLDYPRYIWITEVSSSPLLNKPHRYSRQCLGRVIVDSTAPANTKGVIAMHFADFLLLYDRNEGQIPEYVEFFPNSTPFYHKVHS